MIILSETIYIIVLKLGDYNNNNLSNQNTIYEISAQHHYNYKIQLKCHYT